MRLRFTLAVLSNLIVSCAHAEPDFSGTWHFGTLTPLERPARFKHQSHFSKDEASQFEAGYDKAFRDGLREASGGAFVGTDLWLDFGDRVQPDLRTSLIIDPADGRIPSRTAAAAHRETRNGARRETFSDPEVLDVSERCIADLVPIVSGQDNNYMSILQTPQSILFAREFLSTRIVRLGDETDASADIRLWNGISRGKWEGAALVVVTTNFRDDAGLFGAGTGAVLHERFVLTAPDQILYEFTLTDPATFSRPWTARAYIHRATKKQYEFACHEGNYRTMQGILLGTRMQESGE